MLRWLMLLTVFFCAALAAGEPLAVCFISGSPGYESDAVLANYQRYIEAKYPVKCTLIKMKAEDDLPGLESLEHCDVAVFYTRRLKLSGEQLERIKKYCAAGKPVIGLRTASHGIQTWLEMDKEVLGGSYKGPYAETENSWPLSEIKLVESARDHPVLAGVKPFTQGGSLYKNPELAKDAKVLLTGSIPNHTEPVAWVRTHNGGRVFSTSLGHKKDFENESFRRLLTNAIFWVARRDSANAFAAGDVLPAYTDHMRLDYYLDKDGRERPVKSKSDWEKRRRHVVASVEQVMGPLPKRAELGAAEIKQTDDGDGYTRLKLRLPIHSTESIPAYLFIPKGLKKGERRAAMVALHPTDIRGKDVVANLGRPNRGYAEELAQRGYIVIAPDYPSLGEYAPYDFNADEFTSGSMKGIVNHMYCVDYLQSRQEVDGKRIGAIGHSLGGHNSIFLGLFDSRIKVVVTSCGWTPFHDYYGGKLKGWAGERYMPKIETEFGLNPDRMPFDFYELVAALAPRGFFSCSPLNDSNFDVAGVKKAMPKIEGIYQLYGDDAVNKLQASYPDAGHDFPPDDRRKAYNFIDRILKHTPVQQVP